VSKINTLIEGWLQPDHVLVVLAALVGRRDAHEGVHYYELLPALIDGADWAEEGGWRHGCMPGVVDSLLI